MTNFKRILYVIFIAIIVNFSTNSIGRASNSDKGQDLIRAESALKVVDQYEEAYVHKNLHKMLEYVDQDSEWFKGGFIKSFQAIFKNFSAIRIYHWGRDYESFGYKSTLYEDGDTIVIRQYNVYIAYSLQITDMNERWEEYHLKKKGENYKIFNYMHINTDDVLEVDKGVDSMLEENVDEAILHFQKAIELNPKNSVAYCRLGEMYWKTGKADEAIPLIKKAIEISPGVGYYLFSLSQAYLVNGDKEKGHEVMAEALKLDPGLEIFLRTGNGRVKK